MRSPTHLHLVLRLRLSGAVSLLLLYTFMAWRRTTLLFYTLQSFSNIEMSTAEWDCRLYPRSKRSHLLCSVRYHASMGWHGTHRMTASSTMQKYSKERVPLSDVHSIGQKSISLKFSKSRTRSDVRYSCHHNLSPPSRSFTVRNKQPSTCSSWLVVACKVTYPSRLHNKCLSVYLHPSCLW